MYIFHKIEHFQTLAGELTIPLEKFQWFYFSFDTKINDENAKELALNRMCFIIINRNHTQLSLFGHLAKKKYFFFSQWELRAKYLMRIFPIDSIGAIFVFIFSMQ